MIDLLSSYFEFFYSKNSSLSLCQFTCHIVILQTINCSVLRTLVSFTNQWNSFRLDKDAIQLKGDHLAEGALRVNNPSNGRVMNKNIFCNRRSWFCIYLGKMPLLDLDIFVHFLEFLCFNWSTLKKPKQYIVFNATLQSEWD